MLDLFKNPTIYITRDIERALGLGLSEAEGLLLDTPGYFIISNFTPFAKSMTKGYKNVLLIKGKGLLDTWELLKRSDTKKFIKNTNTPHAPLSAKGGPASGGKGGHFYSLPGEGKGGVGCPQLLVFKNTIQIEKTCKENNWKLLNPPAELSNKVEEKISQIAWLGSLKKYLPDYKITKCKNIKWHCKPCKLCQPCQPFILQFNRSHTGSGTILVNNNKILENIKNTFPERECRVAPYISGPLFTNNNVVGKDKILLGNISYQITGLKPFTDLPFSTIGNDWSLPHKYLSAKQIKQYQKIATDVGKKLQKSGWRGLFGIDVVVDEHTGKLYLLEINCRQPASTTYESQLQQGIKKKEKRISQIGQSPYSLLLTPYSLTTFEAHLLALQNKSLKKYQLIEIKDGAQVILRNKEKGIKNKKQITSKLQKNKFNVIQYNNTEPNSDLLRIQSKVGIMKEHNIFNSIGNKIAKILK